MGEEPDLLRVANAIRKHIVDAERLLAAGTWHPTWEELDEMWELAQRFDAAGRLLFLKQHGHPVQNGFIVSES